MSDRTFERAVRDWLDDGSDRTPRHAIDAVLLAVKTTPQQRVLRIPRRFNAMPTYLRLAAAAVVVAVVGFGALTDLGRPDGAVSSISPPTAPPSVRPTAAPTGTPTAWITYTSTVYPRLEVSYPGGWTVDSAASRAWRVGDEFPADEMPFAESFVSSGEGSTQIGLLVWEMPHEGDGGPDSFALLKPWAQTFCEGVLTLPTCDGFTDDAVPMCRLLADGCDAGDGAILVPTPDAQYAFFRTWQYELYDSNAVRVVVVAREDNFPQAAGYGGSVALLKAILTKMNVWTPGTEPGA